MSDVMRSAALLLQNSTTPRVELKIFIFANWWNEYQKNNYRAVRAWILNVITQQIVFRILDTFHPQPQLRQGTFV